MSYAESASEGNWVGMLRFAVLNGALWAVGTSWSTAIRAVTLQIIPNDSRDVVLGEIAAATVTTLLSVAVSYTVMQRTCCRRPQEEEETHRGSAVARPRSSSRI
jgi:hypothetical protein